MLSGDRPLPDSFEREAVARKLAVTPVLKFNSMVQKAGANAGAGDAPALLADVKAIGKGYPLRGTLLLVDPDNEEGRVANGIPPSGETWVDTRLAARLDTVERLLHF